MRLNTLGGIRVLSDGNVVAGSAAQPRRLAVLALLARAGRSSVTREKIIALLWPDEPDERARRSLNQAVYALRRDLGGEDTLVGSKDLRLNLDLIEVDVVEFDDAIRANDVDTAVQLYAGAFLDGFYLQRAPEFEHWVEAERALLAQEYAAALERVATRASERGDGAAAVAHWRKLAGNDPLNARIALGVMRALVAAGDPGGALQHARLHETLLDQELGLPPDRDVATFARELRKRSDVAAANAPATPPTPAMPAEQLTTPAVLTPVAIPAGEQATDGATEPELSSAATPPGHEVRPDAVRLDAVQPKAPASASADVLGFGRWWIAGAAVLGIVAVALAVNVAVRGRLLGSRESSRAPVVAVGAINDYTSSPDSSGVARALRDMLATNLARSPDLTVVSASRLLEIERQMDGGAPPTAGAIVPVARQAGATTLVDGALYRLGGDTLRLDLRVTSLRDGSVLRAYTVMGRDAFALADSATGRVVEELGSTAPKGSVADATTRSVTAYRLYEEGLRSYYLGDVTSSARLFDAALAEDSTFAMAAYYAALANRTNRADVLRKLRRAVRLAARASERERLIIQGGWAEVNNLLSLRAIGESLSTRYPTEVEGHYYLGRALVNAGSFLEAIAPLRRVEVMDSLSLRGGDARCAACDALGQQIAAYMLADSMAAAERVTRRWIAARPNAWSAHAVLGAILQRESRPDLALAEFRTVDSLDAVGSYWDVFATLWTTSGDFERAEQTLRAQIEKGRDPTNGHWYLAIALRYEGRMAEALGEARAFRRGASGLDRIPPGAADPSALQEAQVLREMGRYRESAALFDSISRFSVAGAESSAVLSGRVWSLTHEAGALAVAGDTSRLAALADTIEVYGSKSNQGRDNRLHHHVRGLLLAARGDDSAAVVEFRRAIFSLPLGYTRTNVEMARALLRLARYADAVAVLEPALRGATEAANLYATHPEVRLLLAEAYAGSGKVDRANAELEWVRRAWVKADPVVRPQLDSAARMVASLRGG